MESKYAAFISYRHLPLDIAVAKRLHKLIERYRVPRDLRKNGGKSIGRVFRDQDELPLTSDLTQDIYDALDHSEYLIVVCTPDTPKSLWVRREIQHFISVHGRKRVLTVLAAGTMEESVPEEITTVYAEDGTVADRIEPLCAFLVDEDWTKVLKNLRSEFLRLMAAILGCPYDSIVQRQKRYQARLMTMAAGAAGAVAAVIMALLINWNLEVTAKNEEISGLNTQIQEQLAQTQLNESKALTLLSQSQLAEGDRLGAVESALGALAGERPYYAPAEAALTNAVHAYEGNQYYEIASLQLYSDVRTVLLSDDGHYAVAVDEKCCGTCIDLQTGQTLWSGVYLGFFAADIGITADNKHLMVRQSHGVVTYDLMTGEEKQTDRKGNVYREEFRVMSPDAATIVTGSILEKNQSSMDVAIFDRTTAAERCRISLDKSYRHSCFSTDGRYLLLIPMREKDDLAYSGAETVVIDCVAGTAVKVPLRGVSILAAAIPEGGFLALNVEGAQDETGEFTLYHFDDDGAVIQSLTVCGEEAVKIGYLFATDGCFFAVEKDGSHVKQIDWRYGLDDMGCTVRIGTRPNIYSSEEVPLLAVQPNGNVVAVDSGNDIYQLVFSDGQYEVRDALYGEIMEVSSAFVNSRGGDVIALVDDQNRSRVIFVRMSGNEPEDVSHRIPGGYTAENAWTYIEELLEEPKAAYRKYDAQTGTLYWGETKEQAKASMCPYATTGKKSAVYHGGNDLVVIAMSEAAPAVTDGFAVFSAAREQWKWFDYPSHWNYLSEVIVATEKRQVIVFPEYNTEVCVLDFDTGETVYCGRFPIARNIGDMKLICGDRFLLVSESLEGDGHAVWLVDTDTWEILGRYDTSPGRFDFLAEWAVAQISPDGKRLYIGNRRGYVSGLIIDMESWTLLAKVSAMACYDPETDSLLCIDPKRQALVAWPAYEKEDLIAMGKDILAGS